MLPKRKKEKDYHGHCFLIKSLSLSLSLSPSLSPSLSLSEITNTGRPEISVHDAFQAAHNAALPKP